MPPSAFESIVLPDHGGHSMIILCPPAAAIRRARFANPCQTICEKSIVCSLEWLTISSIEDGDCGIIGFSPVNIFTSSEIFFAGIISISGIRAASIAFSSGTITRLYHFSRAKITVGNIAGTERTMPSRASSHTTNVSLRSSWGIAISSATIPRAIGRSKLGPFYEYQLGQGWQ